MCLVSHVQDGLHPAGIKDFLPLCRLCQQHRNLLTHMELDSLVLQTQEREKLNAVFDTFLKLKHVGSKVILVLNMLRLH